MTIEEKKANRKKEREKKKEPFSIGSKRFRSARRQNNLEINAREREKKVRGGQKGTGEGAWNRQSDTLDVRVCIGLMLRELTD